MRTIRLALTAAALWVTGCSVEPNASQWSTNYNLRQLVEATQQPEMFVRVILDAVLPDTSEVMRIPPGGPIEVFVDIASDSVAVRYVIEASGHWRDDARWVEIATGSVVPRVEGDSILRYKQRVPIARRALPTETDSFAFRSGRGSAELVK